MQRWQADRAAYWAVGLILFYIFSVGPVARLGDAGYIPQEFAVVYKPLIAMAKVPVVGPPFWRFLQFYVELWDKPPSP